MVTPDTVNILRTRRISADCCVLLTATCKNISVYAQAKEVYKVAKNPIRKYLKYLHSEEYTSFLQQQLIQFKTDSHKFTNHKIITAKEGL